MKSGEELLRTLKCLMVICLFAWQTFLSWFFLSLALSHTHYHLLRMWCFFSSLTNAGIYKLFKWMKQKSWEVWKKQFTFKRLKKTNGREFFCLKKVTCCWWCIMYVAHMNNFEYLYSCKIYYFFFNIISFYKLVQKCSILSIHN